MNKLEKEEFHNDVDAEPLEKSWGTYGDFQLVGNGKVTNYHCGTWKAFYGCLRTELHKRISLDGVVHKNEIYLKKVHNSCDKPSCPVCYKFGWAVREAGKIEGRLAEASKRFGVVEHIVCSVPSIDYGLEFEVLRKKAKKILFDCGVVGGVMIFHAFRYNLQKHWYFNPHFHVLGFILGGYSGCRHCKGGDCYSCEGFEGRVYRAYRDNGYIVKVFDERKTVGGTAWYQLNHSSIKVGVERFHVAVWFGVCSYRKLKVTVEKRKNLCPVCQHELVKVEYSGSKCFVIDRSSPDYERDSFEDFEEDGRPVWSVVEDNG